MPHAICMSVPSLCSCPPQALSHSPLDHRDACKFVDILGCLTSKTRNDLESNACCHQDEKTIIRRGSLAMHRQCAKHGKACQIASPDIEIAGPHCNEHSTQGKRLGRHGWTTRYFLTLVKQLKDRRVPAVLLENVSTGEFASLVSFAST